MNVFKSHNGTLWFLMYYNINFGQDYKRFAFPDRVFVHVLVFKQLTYLWASNTVL